MKRRLELDLLIMVLIPIFVGLGFAALTTWSVFQAHKREGTYVATTGTVTSLKRSSRFGDPSKAAYVTFTDHRGRPCTFLTKSSTSPSRYAVGQAVAVLYDPTSMRNDLDASIDSFSEGWLDPVSTGLTASIFVVSGLGILIVAWPRLTRAPRQRKPRMT